MGETIKTSHEYREHEKARFGAPQSREAVPSALHGDIGEVQQEIMVREEQIIEAAHQMEGFKTSEEFRAGILAGNRLVTEVELPKYQKEALFYLLNAKNGHIPKLDIICQCSDGRVTGENLVPDPLVRYANNWVPAAGGIVSPTLKGAVDASENPAQQFDALMQNPTTRAKIFADLEAAFGEKIRHQTNMAQAATIAGKKVLLGKEYPLNITSEVRSLADTLIEQSGDSLHASNTKIEHFDALLQKMENLPAEGLLTTIELQSHSAGKKNAQDTEHENHGCGAHGSDTNKALLTSALNALALREFLKECYPDVANRVRVVRTHHMTGKDEKIVDAERMDVIRMNHPNAQMDPEIARRIAGLFSPVFHKNEQEGLVRDFQGNAYSINQVDHDEYIIRVSEYHKANGLEHTSVLEQVMLEDLDLTETIVLKLLSIAQGPKNRAAKERAKGKMQPIFIHLDTPVENAVMYKRYHDLYHRLKHHPQLIPLLESGQLSLQPSQTRRQDPRDPKSLKTTFFPESMGFPDNHTPVLVDRTFEV